MTPKLTKYIPTVPTLKQTAFLLLDEYRDVFYGGAAGGGKSESLLMAGLQYVDVPNYNALMLRRTFRDLSQPQALMSRARAWLDPFVRSGEVRWNSNDKRFTFPSGATLTFGYLEGANDHLQYQGAEFQFIGFDEVTQFYEYQVLYLFSRLRKKTGVPVPLRLRSAGNPGGIGHQWVKQRYIVEGMAKNRPFVPASVYDNPHIDLEEYLQSLAELDHITRKQLLEGDWDASYDGGLFKRDWFIVEDDTPPLREMDLLRHWDLAASEPTSSAPDPDYTAGVLLGRHRPSGIYYVLDVARDRRLPAGVERLVAQVAEQDGPEVDVSIEQEPGSAGKALIAHYATHVLPRRRVMGVPSSGDKVTRAKPLSSQFEFGAIRLKRGGWNADFINELVWFPQQGVHDDQVDGLSGAYGQLAAPHGDAQMIPASIYGSQNDPRRDPRNVRYTDPQRRDPRR